MRLLKLKFYFDNKERDQKNVLGTFEVKSDEDAVKLLLRFENEGAYIKKAYLVPNHSGSSKTLSVDFDYKDLPFYKFLKGSN